MFTVDSVVFMTCFKHQAPVSVACKGCKCVLFCRRDDCADDIRHTSICADTPQKRMRNFCEATKYCRSDLSVTYSAFGGLAILNYNNPQHYFMESHRRNKVNIIPNNSGSYKYEICSLCESSDATKQKTMMTPNMKKYNYLVCDECQNDEMCGCCFYTTKYCLRRRLIVLWFLKPLVPKDIKLLIYNLVFFLLFFN